MATLRTSLHISSLKTNDSKEWATKYHQSCCWTSLLHKGVIRLASCTDGTKKHTCLHLYIIAVPLCSKTFYSVTTCVWLIFIASLHLLPWSQLTSIRLELPYSATDAKTIPVVVCAGWRLTSRCYLMHTQLLLICASVSLIVDKLSRFAAAPVVEEEGLQAKSVKNQGSNQCWMFSSVART